MASPKKEAQLSLPKKWGNVEESLRRKEIQQWERKGGGFRPRNCATPHFSGGAHFSPLRIKAGHKTNHRPSPDQAASWETDKTEKYLPHSLDNIWFGDLGLKSFLGCQDPFNKSNRKMCFLWFDLWKNAHREKGRDWDRELARAVPLSSKTFSMKAIIGKRNFTCQPSWPSSPPSWSPWSSSPESLSHWNGEMEDLDTEQLADLDALSDPINDIKEEQRDPCRWNKPCTYIGYCKEYENVFFRKTSIGPKCSEYLKMYFL